MNRSARASEKTTCGVGEGTRLVSVRVTRNFLYQLTSWTVAPKEDIVAVVIQTLLKAIRFFVSIASLVMQ